MTGATNTAQSPSPPLFPVVSRTASILPLRQQDKVTLCNLVVRIQLLLKAYSSINRLLKFIATLQILVMLRPLLEVEHQSCLPQSSWLQLQDEFSSPACCRCSHHPLQRQPEPWNVVRLEGRKNWTGKKTNQLVPGKVGPVASVEAESEDKVHLNQTLEERRNIESVREAE